MRIIRRLVLVLLLLVGVVVVAGYMLPREHQASREQLIAATPEAVYAAITAPADFPRWRRGVKAVEMLPRVAGKLSFRETGSDGAITYVYDRAIPSRRVVARIADETLPYGGTWTFELTPSGNGTTVRITEDGEVSNPVFRFLSRFVFGYHRGIKTYLADLKRHLEADG